jgi:hypothetical protein
VARFYANENFPLPAAEALRLLGHDVVTSLEAGNAGQAIPDEVVLEFAHNHGCMLLTLNRRHFIRLHQQGCRHLGIVVCSLDLNFAALAERIHAAIQAESSPTGMLIVADYAKLANWFCRGLREAREVILFWGRGRGYVRKCLAPPLESPPSSSPNNKLFLSEFREIRDKPSPLLPPTKSSSLANFAKSATKIPRYL